MRTSPRRSTRPWPPTSFRTTRSHTRTPSSRATSPRATSDGRAERVQVTQPRGAQRARRRGASGARRDVADQRERGRPDQCSRRRERPLGQIGGICERSSVRRHHPEQLAMGEAQEYRSLTHEELNKLAGEELPERAAMSLINANVAAPVNLAAALNVASDNSSAYANAEQN